MNILSTSDEINITFKSIRSYSSGNDSIFTILCFNIFEEIEKKLTKEGIHITTQDIYDTFIECFDDYNAFISEKNINMPPLQEDYYDVLVSIINDAVHILKSDGLIDE